MDCSTFAFDLHVLGTPPALILSQDQTLMLNSSAAAFGKRSAHAVAPRHATTQLINARPIWLLRCSIRLSFGGSPPVAFARTDHSGRPIAAVPRADTHLSSFTGDPLIATLAPIECTHKKMTGLCVLARTIQFSKNRPSARQGRATDALFWVSGVRRSHRLSHGTEPAQKAAPRVGGGAFRGTF